MSDPTPDITIPTGLFDRVAGFLVVMQKDDPVNFVVNSGKIKEVAGRLLEELQQLRGPWGVCHICNPPLRMKMEDMKQHDIEKHGRVFRG